VVQTRRGESARSFYALPIDFPSMANLHYDHQQFVGFNPIDDAIIAPTDSIEWRLGMELFDADREGILRQLIDVPPQSLSDSSVKGVL